MPILIILSSTMNVRIDKDTIEQIKRAADIVDIALSLGIKESTYKNNICCPFHDDNSPSFRFFTTNTGVGLGRCFASCADTGDSPIDVFNLVSLSNGCTFIEAVKYVAQHIGFSLPTSENYERQEKTGVQKANELAQYLFANKSLPDSPGYQYLTERGISKEAIEFFNLGFAKSGNNLINYGRAFHNELLELGLIAKHDDNDSYYDFFMERITIPIYNEYGGIIGFAGRTTSNHKAKYINSAESKTFCKGDNLFNLNNVSRANDTCLVVEGYFDVIGLWQNGVSNSVCSMGTALTQRQVELLVSRFKNIIFCFDGDTAGRNAAWHVVKRIMPHTDKTVTFRFVLLPNGQDPFDIISKPDGAQQFNSAVSNGMFLSDFILNEVERIYTAYYRKDSPEAVAQLVDRVNKLIEPAPSSLFKDTLLYQLAAKTKSDIKKTEAVSITFSNHDNPDEMLELAQRTFPNCAVELRELEVLISPNR